MRDRPTSRRGFLGLTGLGASLLAAGAPLSASQRSPAQAGHPSAYPAPQLRVRRNIASLDGAQLASFKKGVQVMKARPAGDPTSWSFQANIHGTLGGPPNPLFNQCEHGTIQFYTWHRGYLYFFERILRAAAEDEALCLPYWDWSTAPALPVPCRLPADTSNPLFDGSRGINDGSQLPPSVVVDDLTAALAAIQFATPAFTGFSPELEGSPHGAVHVLIGGNMGSVPTAANDPVFWLHHCNIDRLLDRWLNQGGGRATPSDSTFLDQTYSFANADGSTVTVRVAEILRSATLGYTYDNTPSPGAAPAAATPLTAEAPDEPRLVASSTPAAVDDPEPKPLGLQPETIKLGFVDQGAPAFGAAAAEATPTGRNRVLLQLDGLDFAEAPGFTYEVFLNLPDEAGPALARLHKAGTLNFFVGRHGGVHGAGGHAADGTKFSQRFDITGLIARLREAGSFSEDNLNIVLKPVTPLAPAGHEEEAKRAAEESAAKAKITYTAANLYVIP